MIFIDANVFIRHLVSPVTPRDDIMSVQATALFRRVEQGSIVVTSSEATIAEVVFILSAKTHYNTPRVTVVIALKTLLRLEHFRLSGRAICLQALDIWEQNPRLSYPDSLAAAYSIRSGHEMATFDERLGRVPDIVRHDFSTTKEDEE